MRRLITAITIVIAMSLPGAANAVTLTFDTGADGLTLGGAAWWSATGGGHIYMGDYTVDNYIYFSDPSTYVNSFQLNALPYENYAWGSTVGSLSMAAFDSGANMVWSDTVDLTGYTAWDNWLSVSVETANIASIIYYAVSGENSIQGFWPSMDNMVINEAAVPEPSMLLLLGSGMLGLLVFRRWQVTIQA